MKQAGIRTCAGIDIDHTCRHPFEANVGAKFYAADAVDLSPEFVDSLFPDDHTPRILAGCAPCQPFSSYSHSSQQDRWRLLNKFGDLIYHLRPEIITMENVPGLVRHPVFERYIQTLKHAGYQYGYSVVNCAEVTV